jgi:hypothetical protein
MQNSIMQYNILKSKLSPAYDKYGNRELAEGKNAYRVEWQIVGQCNSMAQAVAMGFCGYALEQIK